MYSNFFQTSSDRSDWLTRALVEHITREESVIEQEPFLPWLNGGCEVEKAGSMKSSAHYRPLISYTDKTIPSTLPAADPTSFFRRVRPVWNWLGVKVAATCVTMQIWIYVTNPFQCRISKFESHAAGRGCSPFLPSRVSTRNFYAFWGTEKFAETAASSSINLR